MNKTQFINYKRVKYQSCKLPDKIYLNKKRANLWLSAQRAWFSN